MSQHPPTRQPPIRPSDQLPTVLLQTDSVNRWTAFDDAIERLVARRHDQVIPLLERVQLAAADGLVACGFLSYESAAAFDPVLATHPSGDLPLAWFTLFDPAKATLWDGLPTPRTPDEADWRQSWTPSVSQVDHGRAIEKIHGWIAQGETYQLNYTFRLRRHFVGDPERYFTHLAERHGSGHAAWIDTGRHVLCSLSPELFFRLDGDRVTAQPMKGTAARGRTTDEDKRAAQALRHSPKDRAENVMIVDMVRNDLSRIARPGTVRVPALWEVERYPTLFQMTSTCEASSDAPLTDLLAALFPSASITGAPKVRTMQLIREIETGPRGIYTGAIGSVGPGRRADFNVAIRTVHLDRVAGTAEYGTGGGIVWDSDPDSEFAECLTKALVVTAPEPRFELVETLRWEPVAGFPRLERHLTRLTDSAAYFGWPVSLETIEERLDAAVAGKRRAQRVRLLSARSGAVRVEAVKLEDFAEPRRLALAPQPVDSQDRFLCHKTTHRAAYDRAREQIGDADDVLLWNERGEVTESTLANLVVERDGEFVTPPVSCGLLPGVLRQELLDGGRIREAVVRRPDLLDAQALHLISSLRGWLTAELVPIETPPRQTT